MYGKTKQILRKALKQEEKLECGLYRYLSDRETTEKIREGLGKIPVSNGSAYYKKINKNVGIIADEFIYMVYKDCCNLIYLTPDTWRDVLGSLDVVIIVSAWHGLNNEWNAIYKKGSFANQQIEELKKAARERDIPVVFYSKEDPPNFEVFLSLAENVDVIFTSAEECIEKYGAIYPNTPCYVLPFAINPLLHNPIGLGEFMFENTVVFAGSWMKKYPVRTEEQTRIFEQIKQVGLNLTIIDRNFERNNRNYLYPTKYRSDVVTSFSYEEIAKIYKMFPYVLNLNSVQQSNTMFANRVYDASACGAILLSNESKGMERLFPEVQVVREASDIQAIAEMAQEELQEKRRRILRNAFQKNTAYENMTFVLQCAGVTREEIETPTVGVVVSGENNIPDRLQDLFYRQSYKKKLLLREEELSDRMQELDYLAFWSEEQEYDEYYLEDMLNGFKFTDVAFVTRDKFKGHVYVQQADDNYQSVFACKKEQKIISSREKFSGSGYRIY